MIKIIKYLSLCLLIFVQVLNAPWVSANGAGGGRTTCSASMGSNLYAGTIYGGIIMSPDSGKSWTNLNSRLQDFNITCISANHQNIYAGTWGGNLYCLSDNGSDWEQIDPDENIYYISALYTNDSTVIAATDSGIYISKNNGQSWIASNSGLDPVKTTLGFDINSLSKIGNNIFAGTYGGIYQADIDSLEWKYIGLENNMINCLNAKDSTLYIGASPGLFSYNLKNQEWTSSDSAKNMDIISIHFSGNNTIFGESFGNIYISSKLDSDWRILTDIFSNSTITTVCVKDSIIFLGTDRENFVSGDLGQTWSEGNTNLDHKIVRSIALFNNNIFVGSDGAIFRSRDNGLSWETALECGRVNKFCIVNDSIYADDGQLGIFLSADNGNTWERISSDGYIYNFSVFKDVYIASHLNGFIRTTDLGDGWYISNSGLSTQNIYEIAANDSLIFVATDKGIFSSQDKGLTWEYKSDGIQDSITLALMADNSQLFAGTFSDGIYRSTNNGDSWVQCNTGLENLRINKIYKIDQTLFVSTYYGGVSVSTDNGDSWHQANLGLKNMDPICFDSDGESILAGFSDGLFKSSIEQIIISGVDKKPAQHQLYFALGQNYPNPFNPTTTISYSVPEAAEIRLTVYDILGRIIVSLVNEEKPAGTYHVNFDGSKLASGVYLYKLQAGDFSDTKKLLLLK